MSEFVTVFVKNEIDSSKEKIDVKEEIDPLMIEGNLYQYPIKPQKVPSFGLECWMNCANLCIRF